MLSLLDKNSSTDNDHPLVCIKEGDLLICGLLTEFDIPEKLESKMVDEPYYGDIDLFGF